MRAHCFPAQSKVMAKHVEFVTGVGGAGSQSPPPASEITGLRKEMKSEPMCRPE